MTKRCSAFVQLFLMSLAVVASGGVFAQSAANYPHKPIRVIVPFSPGGGSDVIANTPEAFARVIAANAEKWGAVGKRLGVKLD